MVPTNRDRNGQGLPTCGFGGFSAAATLGSPARSPRPGLRGARGRPRCRSPTSRPRGAPRRWPACAMRRSASSRGMPRASRRSSRTSLGASTTITASYCSPRFDSTSSGHVVHDDAVLGRGRDLTQELLPDRRMRDRFEVLLASRRRRTPSRRASARSRCRPAWRMSAPNRSTSFSSAGVPGSTTCRAIRSASTTTAPRSSSSAATVDLPDPIPPVNPTINMRRGAYRRTVAVTVQTRVWSAKADGTTRALRARRAAAADAASGAHTSSQERVGSKRGCLTRLVASAALPLRPRRGS